jgi:hypothetical protein
MNEHMHKKNKRNLKYKIKLMVKVVKARSFQMFLL